LKMENTPSLLAIAAALILSLVFILPSQAQPETAPPASLSGRLHDDTDRRLVAKGLVDVAAMDQDIVVDLKYAGQDNFTGQPLYRTSRCYLRQETADKLVRANREFQTMGYRIKIFDAYRPYAVQKMLWAKVAKKYRPFIADPAYGSRHNRGVAVDITLVDKAGGEVEMPTGFDQFGPACHRNYQGSSPAAMENRRLLTEVMTRHGFLPEDIEWWHFDDRDLLAAPILNIPF